MAPVLLTTIDNRGVARLTMNRPEVRNAFNEALIGAICDQAAKLSTDQNVRVIVITGAGSTFCAGADLDMMRRVADYSPQENKDDARRLAHMLHSIYSCEKPTIALVNGAAMGGGVGILAACDIAIAAEDAVFGLTEVKVGLIPAVISPFVMRAMGTRQARRFFMTGERFDAETARRISLVHMVALGSQLEATLEAVIKDLLASGPGAQKEVKELIRAVAFQPVDERTMEDTATRIARVRSSPEGREGVLAFLEKRKPDWAR
ncbi:MAG: enoyl-CoA hydratase/isomerase family protein [Parvularculaceae bacterium]|jgi:methylglutaconyl-CoA hydratase|nr:enoyl-CoA hydratase/isomerase family protein [Parvularculaceae bacterium]